MSDKDEIYDHLRAMSALVRSGSWDELEVNFRDRCESLAGAGQAERIAALDFRAYERRLRVAYLEAVGRLESLA